MPPPDHAARTGAWECERMRILVMGATGYIGGRLTPRLADMGHEVRCLTRRPQYLADVEWADRVALRSGT